jgi:murein DD-endopeptidase MepM/ murein hydrolase activator NlpD
MPLAVLAPSLLWALSMSTPSMTPRLEVRPEGGAVPGGLLVVDVWNYERPDLLSGELAGQELHFFNAGPHHQRALVGLKLEQVPGELQLNVYMGDTAPADGGPPNALTTTARVLNKDFPKRELKVPSKYVSPPKSARKQIAEDKKAVSKAYDQAFGPAKFEGALSLPKPGAEITAHFGDQRTYNGKKQSEHYGTDFNGDIGEPILAAADGLVTLARGCYMSGNTVIISHGAGLFTSYFHMSRMDVKVGQKVERGEQLGLVGKTGRVTGPHLHFGVKVFSRLVDAEEALKLALGKDPTTPVEAPQVATTMNATTNANANANADANASTTKVNTKVDGVDRASEADEDVPLDPVDAARDYIAVGVDGDGDGEGVQTAKADDKHVDVVMPVATGPVANSGKVTVAPAAATVDAGVGIGVGAK